MCQTTRSELEAGHYMSPEADQDKIDKFWQFVEEEFYDLQEIPVSVDASRCYGEITGRLHQKYPRTTDKDNQAWLQRIGVQINDLHLVAEAWSHRLVCVSHDGMDKIKEVLEQEVENREVRFEDWLA